MIPSERSSGAIRFAAIIFSVIAAGALMLNAFQALSATSSGYVDYRHGVRGVLTERVSRDEDPERFAEAVNWLWINASIAVLFLIVCLWFYRRLST